LLKCVVSIGGYTAVYGGVTGECRDGSYCEQIEFIPGKLLEGKEVAYITYNFILMFLHRAL
jgi:hypothetical protein